VPATASLAPGAPKYTPTIPPGYSSEVVLHVDYGTTPDKIRVDWAEDPTSEPASINHMRVVGDRFYLIDDVVHTIKQYRSPGTFVWETESFENLHYCAVAPDGKVYAAGGAAVDSLTCIDDRGKVMWTKSFDDILPRKRMKQFGINVARSFARLQWTTDGLAALLYDENEDGGHRDMVLFLDRDGNPLRALPGQLAAPDGTVYGYKVSNERKPLPVSAIVGKDSKGKTVRTIRPDLGPNKASRLAGNPSFFMAFADPTDGLIVNGHADVPSDVDTGKHKLRKLEAVFWRFGLQGNFKEEWRFPVSIFAHGRPEVVVGSDGCVYRLNFGETGIDVIKYSRGRKANPPSPPKPVR